MDLFWIDMQLKRLCQVFRSFSEVLVNPPLTSGYNLGGKIIGKEGRKEVEFWLFNNILYSTNN